MKKYHDLATLLIDYREYNQLSQLDVAASLDVDVRTIKRWEKGISLPNSKDEDRLVQSLSIPMQVIHNLNSETPLAIYYNVESRTYSHSAIYQAISDASWYKNDFEFDENDLIELSSKIHLEFIYERKKAEFGKDWKLLKADIIERAIEILPQLNQVLLDQSSLVGGYMCVLPIRYSLFEQIKEQKLNEWEIQKSDIIDPKNVNDMVYYIYAIYAHSVPASYSVMFRLFEYFRGEELGHYTISLLVSALFTSETSRQLGLAVIWKDEHDNKLVAGDFDMFLFGKMR